MEQTPYWMWMKKQREMLRSYISQASINYFSDQSWQEKAFAEDAAGSLGRCVWPPRSYTCSFCKREFRSAQALGGHMNVHRRDRARLKQSLSLHHSEVLHHQNHNQNFLKSSDRKCPSEICALDCNIDHNSCPRASATISSSRASALSTQENLSENTLASPYSSSCFAQEKRKGSASVEKMFLSISDSKPDYHQQEMGPREEASTYVHHEAGYVETNLFVGLNSVFCRDQSTGSCRDEAIISCKRTKTLAVSTVPLWILNDKYRLQKEGLDLELRLGDPPKVK